MPKYIATSSSYFKPFSYDELVKPLAQMAEAQNAVADNYDKISMESEGLRRYITDNPEDSMAKELYDDYMSKLTTLQDNLWNNGYNAQARRDLSAARAGYASDITRIAQAVKSRQERSKAYWDIKSKNPDMIMGRDPGTYGLNPYLTNDNFGQDYYTYSGESFMKEVGADAAARANEMLNDPRVVKDPRLVGYLQRITRDGFTSLFCKEERT